MAQNRVKFIEMTTIDSSTLTGTYQPINPGGLPEACFFVRLNNGSTQSVEISFDGVTDNEVVFATQQLPFPTPINTAERSAGALLQKGTVVYAKGTAGVGTIALSGAYQTQL